VSKFKLPHCKVKQNFCQSINIFCLFFYTHISRYCLIIYRRLSLDNIRSGEKIAQHTTAIGFLHRYHLSVLPPFSEHQTTDSNRLDKLYLADIGKISHSMVSTLLKLPIGCADLMSLKTESQSTSQFQLSRTLSRSVD